MRTAAITFCVTMFVVSAVLNIGLVCGYIRNASPDTLTQTAYLDSQRELMTALVEDEQ